MERRLGAERNVDAELVLALGGPPARWAVAGEPSGPPYWLRVWALRGLLWAWDEAALPPFRALRRTPFPAALMGTAPVVRTWPVRAR